MNYSVFPKLRDFGKVSEVGLVGLGLMRKYQ